MHDYLVEVGSDELGPLAQMPTTVDILLDGEQDGELTETNGVVEVVVAVEKTTLSTDEVEGIDVVVVSESDGLVQATTAEVGVVELLAPGPQGVPGPQGPVGPTGPPALYTHQQVEPAAEWLVPHNLGARIMPTLVLTANPEEPVITDVVFVDNNNLLVQWAQPETGWAYI